MCRPNKRLYGFQRWWVNFADERFVLNFVALLSSLLNLFRSNENLFVAIKINILADTTGELASI